MTIAQVFESRQQQHLLYKRFSCVAVNVLLIPEDAAEHEGLMNSGSSRVGVKLLHIPRHASKALLLFWVAIDAHITLDAPTCHQTLMLSTVYTAQLKSPKVAS